MRRVIAKDRLYKENGNNEILLDLQELQNMFENNSIDNNNNNIRHGNNNNDMMDDEEHINENEMKQSDDDEIETEFEWDPQAKVSNQYM